MSKHGADVVVIGAGFGGLQVAKALRGTGLDLLLIDRHNYHTFQPLLYQVATAGLDPEHVAHSVRNIFPNQSNVRFLMDTVRDVDLDDRRVLLKESEPVEYRYLVIAAGASSNFFGIEGAREHAIPIKNLSTAIYLRNHVLKQFEKAQKSSTEPEEGLLNFVVVGGGPTGVETAGALSELFDHVLQYDYPRQLVDRANVILLEMLPHLLDPYHEDLRSYTREKLEEREVDVRTETAVRRVTKDRVHLRDASPVPTQTLIWAAGIKANPLADRLDVPQGRGGRIEIDRDLTLPDRDGVFAIGDIAAATDGAGDPLPQLAPVAVQQGSHAAKQIQNLEAGDRITPFVYHDPGKMATIGRHAAVVELSNGVRWSGFLAWFAWVFLHIAKLIGFRNKMMVFLSWIYNYFTYGSSSRLILEGHEQDRDHLDSVSDPGA